MSPEYPVLPYTIQSEDKVDGSWKTLTVAIFPNCPRTGEYVSVDGDVYQVVLVYHKSGQMTGIRVKLR